MTSEKRHSKNYPKTTLQIFCLSVAPVFTYAIAAVFVARNLHYLVVVSDVEHKIIDTGGEDP